MTIDNSEDAVLTIPAVDWTPQGVAYAALAQAQHDLLKACEQIRVHRNNNEALDIIREAREQMEKAEAMLNGPVWTI